MIIVFCAVLGFVQEYRAERALEALKGMLAPTITVLRDGEEQEVASKELVPGDILVLEAGDKIPADGRLVEIHSLQCDEAPLTGESVPVARTEAAARRRARRRPQEHGVHRHDRDLWKGQAVVTATGMQTEFGKIAKEVAAVETEKTPLERRTEEIGKWLGIITLGICVVGRWCQRRARAAGGNVQHDRRARHDDVRHRARGGRGARGARRHRHRRAGDRHARDGQAQRAGAQMPAVETLGLHQRDLLRQDRHAHEG